MTEPTRPTFIAITSTGGYIGRWYWMDTGVRPDFPYWGQVYAMPDSKLHGDPWGVWAGLFPIIRQCINWRFYD